MTALEKAKAATAALADDEQYELFRWWVESDSFRQRQLIALKLDIAVGIDQLDNGRYQTFAYYDVMQLADEISQNGRVRLQNIQKAQN